MTYDVYLAHHGILGMKWGVRRYQNADGSLTAAGRKRYLKKADVFHEASVRGSGEQARRENRVKEYNLYKKMGLDPAEVVGNSKLFDNKQLINNAKKMLVANGFSDKDAASYSLRLLDALNRRATEERSSLIREDPAFQRRFKEHSKKLDDLYSKVVDRAESFGLDSNDATNFADLFFDRFGLDDRKKEYENLLKNLGRSSSDFKDLTDLFFKNEQEFNNIVNDVNEEVKRRLRREYK